MTSFLIGQRDEVEGIPVLNMSDMRMETFTFCFRNFLLWSIVLNFLETMIGIFGENSGKREDSELSGFYHRKNPEVAT